MPSARFSDFFLSVKWNGLQELAVEATPDRTMMHHDVNCQSHGASQRLQAYNILGGAKQRGMGKSNITITLADGYAVQRWITDGWQFFSFLL